MHWLGAMQSQEYGVAPLPAVLKAALLTVLGGAALTLAAATLPALLASRLAIAPHLAEE